MKIAAYQAPLLPSGSMQALGLIEEQVKWCESNSVDLLCCPEAILGGLADDASTPRDFALRVDTGQLAATLAPLASRSVTTVIGFTETTAEGSLFNSAAVFARGKVSGIYRKRHPAIRRSIYQPGQDGPIFVANGVPFGIMLCNDSNFPDLAQAYASAGAVLLLVPTNNGLRPEIADEVLATTRRVDAALAAATGMPVIRADVAGQSDGLLSLGSSALTDTHGITRIAGRSRQEMLLVAALTELR